MGDWSSDVCSSDLMTSDEKEVDEKLYRVVRKKGSHVNTKVNPDGTKSASQFTDENNDLNGPLDIIEVDMSEYICELCI